MTVSEGSLRDHRSGQEAKLILTWHPCDVPLGTAADVQEREAPSCICQNHGWCPDAGHHTGSFHLEGTAQLDIAAPIPVQTVNEADNTVLLAHEDGQQLDQPLALAAAGLSSARD